MGRHVEVDCTWSIGDVIKLVSRILLSQQCPPIFKERVSCCGRVRERTDYVIGRVRFTSSGCQEIEEETQQGETALQNGRRKNETKVNGWKERWYGVEVVLYVLQFS